MLDLQINQAEQEPTLLFVGAHCDDIEIGCGGTVLALARRYPKARVHWVVLSSGAEREKEAREAARMLLGPQIDATVRIEDFRISYFPAQFASIKDFFEDLKKTVAPDVVFTHYRNDLHQDHRVASELTLNAFRDHAVLEYEIPKFDGDLGAPSAFVALTEADVARKVKVLMDVYATQRNKQWFSPETFRGLMRIRGIECNAADGYAEAFYVRKLRLFA
jgi:LmbE family N-acetylglucosaminyl deacetylase